MTATDSRYPARKHNNAGLFTLIAGLLFFADFVVIGSVLRSNPQLRDYSAIHLSRVLLWVLISVGLSLAPVGMLRQGLWRDGWKRKLGITGIFLITLGSASYIVGTTYVYLNPAVGTRQLFTPLGSLLLTLGMLLISVATFAAGVWTGWRRFVPILVWLYFPLQFPLQSLLFLGANRGPNPFLLGSWGLCWALLGWAIWRSPVTQSDQSIPGQVPPSPRQTSQWQNPDLPSNAPPRPAS